MRILSATFLLLMSLSMFGQGPSREHLQLGHDCILASCSNAILDNGEQFSYVSNISAEQAQKFAGTATFRGKTYSDFKGLLRRSESDPGKPKQAYWVLEGTFNAGQFVIREMWDIECPNGCVEGYNRSGYLTVMR